MRSVLLLSLGGGAGKTFLAANLLPLLPSARALELKTPEGSELCLHMGRPCEPFSRRCLEPEGAGAVFAAPPAPPALGSGEGWLLVDGCEPTTPGWEAWAAACSCLLLVQRGDLQGLRRAGALLKILEARHFSRRKLLLAFTPSYPAQPLPPFEDLRVCALPEFPKAAERLAQGAVPSASDPFSPFGKAARQLAAALQAMPEAPAASEVLPNPSAPLDEEALLKTLLPQLKAELDLDGLPPAELASASFRTAWEPRVRSAAAALLARQPSLPEDRELRARLEEGLLRWVLGLGPLEPLLADPEITEIMVNRPDQVYVEKGGRLVRSSVRFWDQDQLLQIIERIVSPLGRRIDESSPRVDARLPDGSRVNAIIPPLALKGPCLTIRKFPASRLSVEDLVQRGSLSPAAAAFLKAAVERRLNILVSGGTGSGKTTLLNVLSSFIPEGERIITIEDSAELRLQQEHVVSLESRPPNLEGRGEVSIRDLVINALRMRPDRIVVGECRGGEALDMLQAMNTGHDGSLTTVHANSPRDALARVETLCLMSEVALPLPALRRQLASALQLIVQVARLKDGSRKVTAITEITGMEGDTVLTQDLFLFEQQGEDPQGRILGSLRPTGVVPEFFRRAKESGYHMDFSLFATGR